MRTALQALERELGEQISQRISEMETIKAAGTSQGDEWQEWRGVAIGIGAVWRVFARRLVTLTLRLL